MCIEGNVKCWPIASRDNELIWALGGRKDKAFLNKQWTSYDFEISSANDIVSFIESTGLLITSATAAKFNCIIADTVYVILMTKYTS